MSVDNYQKGICGLLIGYYRLQLYQKTKDSQYRQRHLISYKSETIKKSCTLCNKKCKERASICSSRTINDIEAGLPVKNNCYYIDLASKTGHQFPESRKLENLLPQYQKELLHLLDAQDMTAYTSLHQRLSRLNSQLVNVLYYDEMLQVMLMILEIIMYGHYPDQEFIDMLAFLEPHLNKTDQQLAVYLLYQYHQNYLLDYEKSDAYLKKLKPVNLLFKLTLQEKKLTPYSMIVSLSNFQKANPAVQSSWINWFKITSYIALKQWKKALTCIEQSFDAHLSPVQIYDLYVQMGVIAYANQDFETAAFFFKHVWKHMPDVLGFNVIFLMDSLQKTHPDELPAVTDINSEERIEQPLTYKMMNYYINKYQKKATYAFLEEYIVEELKPLFTFQNRYYQLIQNDLVYYCSKTHDYQCLFKFLLIIP